MGVGAGVGVGVGVGGGAAERLGGREGRYGGVG